MAAAVFPLILAMGEVLGAQNKAVASVPPALCNSDDGTPLAVLQEGSMSSA